MIRFLSIPFALVATIAMPVAAQAQSGTFSLPTATPTPGPAPAGPADERAGVAIPPRAQPNATPEPLATPVIQPLPTPTPRASAGTVTAPAATATPRPAPQASTNAPPPDAAASAPPVSVSEPAPFDSTVSDPLPQNLAVPQTLPAGDAPAPAASPSVAVGQGLTLPDWWPFAAGALGGLALIGGGLVWRPRKPKALRLAAPVAGPIAVPDKDAAAPASDLPRLDITLDITSATRSVMMFTLAYRITIATRSQRAVTELSAAVQLACARASAAAGAANAASPGAAQALAQVERVGPHQARTITGQVQLPLSAIQPLRQGTAPLFVPLVHVTLQGDGQRVMTKSFVIGTRSANSTGRVHPILLDQPPGAIAGLVAQPVAMPTVNGPASGPVSAPVSAGV